MTAYIVCEKSGFASVRDREIDVFDTKSDAENCCNALNGGDKKDLFYVYPVQDYRPSGNCFDDGPLIDDQKKRKVDTDPKQAHACFGFFLPKNHCNMATKIKTISDI